MEFISGLAAIVSVLLFLAAIIGLIFPKLVKQKNRSSVLKWILLPAFLLFLLVAFVLPVPETSNVTEKTKTDNIEITKDVEKTAEEQKKEKEETELKRAEEQRLTKEKEAKNKQEKENIIKTKNEEYIEKLSREMKGLNEFNIKKWTKDKTSISLGVALFSAWATYAEEGDKLPLNKKDKKTLNKFKTKLSSVQKRSFPKLRDSYGPIARQLLWEHDISARTIGKGYTTIEFVGALFAANRNIKASQEAMNDLLNQLRFKKARYKWIKSASEFTYYDLKSPKDSALVIWSDGGRYREVK